MSTDLFAGIPVREYAVARAWYERLFGGEPAFLPNDIEAVWEVGAHQYVYIVVRPAAAGHAAHLLYVPDLDARIAAIAERGIEPAAREEYGEAREVVFRDPDGNEFGFGG
ncbi:VOC family protein [Nocardia sp. NPDC050697]|uniref:VOC family protein n=1 Tax=Nocardia sp. NPDC050697 TaxID=3155158 RepID=UPI0033FF1DAC